MRTLEVWYARLSEEDLMSGIKEAARAVDRAGTEKAGKAAAKTREAGTKAHHRDSLQALSKLAGRSMGATGSLASHR